MRDRIDVQAVSAQADAEKPPLPVRKPGATNPPTPRAAVSARLAG
ncbi:hypothetical protein GCM10009654_33580 [Streptomyces hebeiensis]|uniref:Uncharacterized protein n=1 Tax=Streptomyces hebeiensis TaxID=229486 RepID=A0ABN1UY43_9ACTN